VVFAGRLLTEIRMIPRSFRFAVPCRRLVMACWAASISGVAWAGVDINEADEATLNTLGGVGPVKARIIVEERNARGPFKDGADLASRVKGVGPKSVDKWQREGLVFDRPASGRATASAIERDACRSAQRGPLARGNAAPNGSPSRTVTRTGTIIVRK
jgi:competence protein ComEA